MRQGVLLLGEDLKVVSANRAFCEMFRTDRTRAVGMPVDRLFEAGAGLSEIGSQLREVLADHVDTDGTQIEAEIPRSGGVRKLLFSIRRMKPDADGLAHMILSIEPTPSA